MEKKPTVSKRIFHPFFILLIITGLSGCSFAPATTTPVPPTPSRTQVVVLPTITTIPPTPTKVPPTATARPTATNIPLPSLTPSPTPTAGGQYVGDLTNWCMPNRNPIKTPVGNSPAALPQGALEGRYYEHLQAFRLKIPALFCTFVYNAGQPLPTGTKLEISYTMANKPWLTVELKPVPDVPNAGYAILTHSFILNPPVWEATYKLVVRGADGNEKYRTKIILWKTLPPKCWDGTYPDPVTMWCPKNPTPDPENDQR